MSLTKYKHNKDGACNEKVFNFENLRKVDAQVTSIHGRKPKKNGLLILSLNLYCKCKKVP